ncbi:MAG: TolB family protein, partial [Planctomycetota bacterium]
MRSCTLAYRSLLTGAVLAVVSAGANGADAMPRNLALKAKVSASSQFSGSYRPQMATNGALADSDWAVKGTQSGHFTLRWAKPVEATQIIYWARTTSSLLECFKDYEVYVNDAEAPAVKGRLERRRGPQMIGFTKQKVTKIHIKFLSSHPDSPNPGAAEIGVYATPVTKKQLAAMATRVPVFTDRTAEAKALRRELIDGKLGFRDILLVKRHPLNISHVYVYHVEGYIPGGGLYIYTPDEEGGKVKCIYDAKQGMITTADLSYDGKEIVFALKRGGMVRCRPIAHAYDIPRDVPRNNYQVFRINIDGTGLTQLTGDASNNLDPCWLPDGGIAFISDRKPAYAYCYVVTSPVVYRMDRDGKKQKRLSANYLMDFTPSVMNDGRIVYTRWEYVDRAACPIQSLWTMNPDGTGLSGLYGNRVTAPGTFMDAQPIPGEKTFIATATNHNGPCRGAIVLIDPTKGANNLKAMTNLTPEVDPFRGSSVYGNGINGPYEKPMPIGGDRFLVSKHGLIELRDFDRTIVPLVKPNDRMGFYSPQPVVATETPPLVVGTPMNRDVDLP